MAEDHKSSKEIGIQNFDVDSAWMNSMRKRFIESTDGPSHKKHLIYRVHPTLRKQNKSAYEPIAISIGPYHRGKKHLSEMEVHKQRYLHHLLHRSRNPDVILEQLVKLMKAKEEQVRRCYTEKIKLRSNPFIEMLLLDGCFIVEFIVKFNYCDQCDDLFLGPSWRYGYVINDLLLLENQLPFFILQEIFELVKPNLSDPLTDLVTLAFELIKHTTPILDPEKPLKNLHFVYHLLHLFHTHLTPNPLVESVNSVNPCLSMFKNCWRSAKSKEQNTMWVPSASMLHEAGVKFKPGDNNLLDIKFHSGVMEIPKLMVEDTTDAQFRNLIAFEQCCLHDSIHYFTSYVTLMDCIVNTSKDIEILHKEGILNHKLGSDDEVALVFNRLCKGIVVDEENSYLSETFEKVNKYRSRKIPEWRASLTHKYFHSPWALLSLTAAVFILLLTVTQTAFSVLSCS